MSFLVTQNLPGTLPVFQCLHDLSGLGVLHLLPQVLNHPIYILSVANTLREAVSADHFSSEVVQLLQG